MAEIKRPVNTLLDIFTIPREKATTTNCHTVTRFKSKTKHRNCGTCKQNTRKFMVVVRFLLSPSEVVGPLSCGLFFQHLHNHLCPRTILVQSPVDVLLLDLPVIDIENPLHQVKNQALVQVGSA